MNFFTQLSEIGIKDVTIEIKTAQDGRVSVVTTPKTVSQDKGLKTLKPLILTATAEELDEGYFKAIVVPLQKTADVFNNIESFEAQLAESNKNTEAAKKEKDAVKNKKEKLKKLENNAKKYVESLKNPKHWVQREEKLLEIINSIIEIESENKYVATLKKELENQKAKALSGSLFEETIVEEHIEPVIDDLPSVDEPEEELEEE